LANRARVRSGLLLALALGCDTAAEYPPAPAMVAFAAPGPARQRQHAAVEANRACTTCHVDEAAEWQGSLHQRANIEPAYLRAFAIEPMPFCRSCHAPESLVDQAPDHDVSALGVGCVTCHLTSGEVLATPGTGSAPHGLMRDAAFASSRACEGCHQFRFPGRMSADPADFMQTTVMEHEASGSSQSCADCHMPREANGKRSHRFVSSRDPEKLKQALSVSAERIRGAVKLALRPVNVGHSFPTGDLFRRLEVSVEAYGDDHAVVASERRYLTRHFDLTSRGRMLLKDDRLKPDGATLEFDLGPQAAGFPIAYRVAYQRVAHPQGIDEAAAVLEDEVVLAQGDLPAP
jgi:hypothetical protein